MLTAYFDESGIHDQSTVISVGGLVGQTREWMALARPWREKLDVLWRDDIGHSRIEWFHAYECEYGVEQFAGLDRVFRDSLINGLSKVLTDRALAYVGGALYREAWDLATNKMKQHYGNPYAFCVATAIIRACDFAQEIGPQQRVAFVFASPKIGDRELAARIHAQLYDDDYPGIGSLTFSTPQELIQLQAADLIAFETYWFLKAKAIHGMDGFKVRDAMERFHQSGKPMRLGYFDKEGMAGIISDLPQLQDAR